MRTGGLASTPYFNAGSNGLLHNLEELVLFGPSQSRALASCTSDNQGVTSCTGEMIRSVPAVVEDDHRQQSFPSFYSSVLNPTILPQVDRKLLRNCVVHFLRIVRFKGRNLEELSVDLKL